MESEVHRKVENGDSFGFADVVQDLASMNLNEIPHRYLRPEAELDQVSIEESLNVPVIDMSKLLDQNNSSSELERLHLACKEWGFFQIINHGVPKNVIERMKMDVDEFFQLPLESKQACAWLQAYGQGYGPSSVVPKDQKLDWGDMLFLIPNPISLRNMGVWPSQPTSFKESLDNYSWELQKVTNELLKSMSTNLGLSPETLSGAFENGRQGVRMNLYPPCLQANKVLGFTPHFDINGLTVVLEVNDVQGLQYKKNGKWVPVKPVPGAFIVNNGDSIETMSNGGYKSIAHRVVVNPEKCRLSIAALHGPQIETMIGPLSGLVTEENKAKFKAISYGDYVKMFIQEGNDEGKRLINHLKIGG